MALPTSTIVMALVTCVPFGLAIRDTVSGKDGPSRHRGDDYEDYQDRDDERERRYEREAAVRQDRFERAEREARAKQWKKLYGVNVASLGSAFDGLWWDMPERQIGRALGGSLGRFKRMAGVEIQLTAEPRLLAIEVSAATPDYDEDLERCRELRDELTAAWGDGAATEDDQLVWFNAELRSRAVFSSEGTCSLRFEQAVAVADWIKTVPDSVIPVGVVGQPLAALQQLVGERGTLEDNALTWQAPGVAGGNGVTHVTAVIENGKVQGLSVGVVGDERVVEQLTAHLTSLYGKPREEDTSVTWKAKPRISLQHDGGSIELTVGTFAVD